MLTKGLVNPYGQSPGCTRFQEQKERLDSRRLNYDYASRFMDSMDRSAAATDMVGARLTRIMSAKGLQNILVGRRRASCPLWCLD
jgi:hypothetical protein